MKQWIHSLGHSFAFRLFLLHFREHFVLLLVWILLVLILQGNIFSLFGIRLLLGLPEYQGETTILSYAITGTTFGALWLTWNLVTYLLYARRFPFLGTLIRPFRLFSLNNSLVPVGFLLYYLGWSAWLQHIEAGYSWNAIFLHSLGFVGGALTIIVVLATYLAYTNHDIRRISGFASRAIERRERREEQLAARQANWGVENYLSTRGHVRRVRSVSPKESAFIRNIYRQNHLNTLLLMMVCLILLILLGRLASYSVFRIPAGGSLFILITILLALTGAISYWFGPWRFMVFLFIVVMLDGVTGRWANLQPSQAYGLDYNPVNRPAYTNDALDALVDTSLVAVDRLAVDSILMRWKARQTSEKPVFVILSASGGGLKAARWTMHVAQQLQQAIPNSLLDQTGLMTGASGGVLALAYLRELWWLEKKGTPLNWTDTLYRELVSQDLLNSIAFSMVSSDLFHIGQFYMEEGQRYRKDRGFHFERQWQENTGGILNKRMRDYTQPEADAEIPLLLISPAILNDGRRLLISSRTMSHLSQPPSPRNPSHPFEVDAVDFNRFFHGRNPGNLKFSSALRMNATFPYILPTVGLPSEPVMDIMDAGIRDNFGVSLALRFVQQHQQWLTENTSGVVLLQVRCWQKEPDIEPVHKRGIISEGMKPFGLLGQQSKLQDFEHDAATSLLMDLFPKDFIKVVRFIYEPSKDIPPPSLSFHLTRREKQEIQNAWGLSSNQNALRELQEILKDR